MEDGCPVKQTAAPARQQRSSDKAGATHLIANHRIMRQIHTGGCFKTLTSCGLLGSEGRAAWGGLWVPASSSLHMAVMGGQCHLHKGQGRSSGPWLPAAAVRHHPAGLVPSLPEAALGPCVPVMDLGLLWVSHKGSLNSTSHGHSAVKLEPGKGGVSLSKTLILQPIRQVFFQFRCYQMLCDSPSYNKERQ